MLQFTVDKSLCTKCGLCLNDCVAHIIAMDENGQVFIPEDKKQNCIKCQHCMAVCPSGAISVCGRLPKDSLQTSEASIPGFDQMQNLVRLRRSIRHYKNENVDSKLLKDILHTLAYAPTGVNAMELTFNVIDDRDVMQQFKDRLIDLFLEADKAGLVEAVNPRFHRLASMPREIISAEMFRNAPHVLVVSADPNSPCAREDIALTLAYFELLAQSAGLGTVWWGYFSYFVSLMPEIKSIVGIPEGHLFYAMLFGLPSIRYARAVQKDDAAVIKRIVF